MTLIRRYRAYDLPPAIQDRLLAAARNLGIPDLRRIGAEFCFYIESYRDLTEDESQVLEWLLSETFEGEEPRDHLADYDGLLIPGGFAHGDYLRPGAIARFSPVMDGITEFSRNGGPVVGEGGSIGSFKDKRDIE